MPQASGIVNYFSKRPKPTPKVKAPFLIETKEWDSPSFEWLVDARYVVSSLGAASLQRQAQDVLGLGAEGKVRAPLGVSVLPIFSIPIKIRHAFL
jgi:hypothetical protein